MPDLSSEIEELRRLIAELTRRVYSLEQGKGVARAEVGASPASAGAGGVDIPPPMLAPSSPPPPSPWPHPEADAQRATETSDLERTIGSEWLNRIGIIAMLIGMSYFLKYAFENQWIGPAGRIAIGLAGGIGLILWSERFRRRGHQRFSYSLKAIGIGGLYFSLWAAFQLYHLVPASVAFVAMAAVTGATAWMAIRQDSQLLAGFALAGGFATPVLLSTGENHEVVLFSYVALLNIGTLVMLRVKPWQRLLFLSFIGTQVLYFGWYSTFYRHGPLALTFLFATLFFALFALAPIFAEAAFPVHVLPVRTDVLRTGMAVAILNAGVYFIQGHELLESPHRDWIAWFALALAVFYLLLSKIAGDAGSSEGGLPMLHIALAAGFLATAIAQEFDGHWVTIGWLVESAALMWVAQRASSGFLRALGSIGLALAVANLLISSGGHTDTLFFNARFATYLVAIAVMAWLIWPEGRRPEGMAPLGILPAVVIAMNLLALVAVTREISDVFSRRMASLQPGTDRKGHHDLAIARDFTYSAFWMAYGAALMLAGFWRRSAFLRWQALALIAATVLKVFLYDVSQLNQGYRILSFIILGVLLLGLSFAYQRDWLKLAGRPAESDARPGA